MRSNIALALGRNADAVALLKDLQDEKRLEGFSSYNLAIALLRAGDEKSGREYLDRTGRIRSSNPATRAIEDKANLVLSELLLNENDFTAAKQVLDRVRMSGPFSNRALLNSGWADASRQEFEEALVPWSMLAEREVTDPAAQEAMLDVPYAYSRLGKYGTAALKYEAALAAFDGEIAKLNTSITSIREGTFLKSLLREEIKQDAGWIVKLRTLPETPETFYLLDLMASRDFQEALKNYLDLAQLRAKLETWPDDLTAFDELTRARSTHYEPLCPPWTRNSAGWTRGCSCGSSSGTGSNTGSTLCFRSRPRFAALCGRTEHVRKTAGRGEAGAPAGRRSRPRLRRPDRAASGSALLEHDDGIRQAFCRNPQAPG